MAKPKPEAAPKKSAAMSKALKDLGYKDYTKLLNSKIRPKLRADYTYDEFEHVRLQTILFAADKVMALIRSRGQNFHSHLWTAFSLMEAAYNIIHPMAYLKKREMMEVLLYSLEVRIEKELNELPRKGKISRELTRDMASIYRLILELRQYVGMGVRVRRVHEETSGDKVFSRGG